MDMAPTRHESLTSADRLATVFRILSLASLALLFFLMGMASAYFRTFPYDHVRDAARAAKALASFIFPEPNDRAFRTSGESGIGRYDPTMAFNGVTLFTDHPASRALLIDMKGKVLHEWSLPFSAIWNETASVASPMPDDRVYWRDVELLPNGDLVVVYHGTDQTPYGYGLAKINKDSELLWSYLGHVHHDATLGEDGLVYTISQRIQKQPVDGLPELDPPILEDTIVVLSATGEKIKEVSVFEACGKTAFRSAVRLAETEDHTGDYFHVNDIEPIGASLAKELPFAKEGQVLISIRNLSALAIVDLEDEAVVWFARGPWVLQHDPDILEGGRIMLFDNAGDFAHEGRSRILEFDPATREMVWEYGSTTDDQLHSPWAGSQQRLPNGNVLITEATKGRLIEVTREGDIVWEYFSEKEEHGYATQFMESKRFAREDLAFDIKYD